VPSTFANTTWLIAYSLPVEGEQRQGQSLAAALAVLFTDCSSAASVLE
jgi:hypothetical protein